MKKIIIRVIAVLILAIAGFMGYMYLTQPELAPVPPIPSASNEVAPAATSTEPVETAETSETVTEPVETTAVDPVVEPDQTTTSETTETASIEEENKPEAGTAQDQNILVIEVAGQANGTVEILLNSEIAPGHVAQIKALARKGSYDNVVFHRVIEGFMAQTGDVEFGRQGGSISRAGMGGSRMDDLKAEFSDQLFVKGVVGMARSNSPDSANSQFFIMFDDAPFLNGKYTIVGRVISGMDVVDTIKKGNPDQNGSVSKPDFMRSVTVKSDDQS